MTVDDVRTRYGAIQGDKVAAQPPILPFSISGSFHPCLTEMRIRQVEVEQGVEGLGREDGQGEVLEERGDVRHDDVVAYEFFRLTEESLDAPLGLLVSLIRTLRPRH